MNSHQRRVARRLYERAFGDHIDYLIAISVYPSKTDGHDVYDGIRRCENCGNYTTGRLCRSCAEQEMIDSAETEDDLRYKNGKYL